MSPGGGNGPAMAPPATARESARQPRNRVSPWWLAVLAGPLSFGISAPALVLPNVAADLGVSIPSATWTVTAFGWGIAVGTPLMAGLLGRWSIRPALAVCGLLVLAGAAVVSSIPALPALVVGMALQALGTAGLLATAMHLADSARTMGLITASLAVLGATGPLVGSLVGDLLSWQATLALPVLSLLGLPAAARPAVPAPVSRDRFDHIGAVLLTALVTALVLIPHRPVPAVLGALAAAALLGMHLRARPTGFVPTVLVRTPAFLGAAVLALSLAVINFGILYAAPTLLHQRAAWTTGQIGVAMLWPYLLGGALSWAVVAASTRARPHLVTAALIGAGVAAPALVVLTGWIPALLIAMALGSIAAAGGQGTLAVRATSAVPDDHRPAAIGLFNLSYLLGAAFGPAIVSLLLTP